LSKTGILSHNCHSRYATKSTKGFKNLDDSLDSNKNKQVTHSIGAHGWVKFAKKAITPPLVTSPTENPKPKSKKIVFQSQLADLLNP